MMRIPFVSCWALVSRISFMPWKISSDRRKISTISLSPIDLKTPHIEFITEVLSASGIPLEKQAALDYLAAQGYVARRSYTNLENLLINARAKRNQKKEND